MRALVIAACVLSASAFVSPRSRSVAPALRSTPIATESAAEDPVAGIQFYTGIWESNVPDVKLTRSKDGDNGVATFRFDAPSFFNCATEAEVPVGSILAMTMIDEEGPISTPKVNAKFIDGLPSALECQYEMVTAGEWERFMRFMSRYAEANGLGFSKAK